MNWTLSAIVALLALATVIYAHVQVESRAWSTWTLALTGARQTLVRWLRTNVDAHTGTIADALRVARADLDAGRATAALEVVLSAQALLERHTLMLRRWLRRWADVASALVATVPAPSMPDGAANLTALRHLTRVQQIADLLLPTRAMRFQAGVSLRLTALKWLAWTVHAATLRARRPGQLAHALDQLDAAQADLAALDGQAMATLEHVLRALPADWGSTSAGDGPPQRVA